VCFLSGNIARVDFLAEKPTRPQAKITTSVIFPLKKYTTAVFCFSHATIKSNFRHFLARIVANLIQKFETQSSALTSRWRYADGSNDAITSISLGPVVRRPTIRMTSLKFDDVNHNAPMWYIRAIRKNTALLDCTLDNGKNSVEMFE
jgi:hypothetical protein